MAVNSFKVMHYFTVNMSQKILFHPADSQYKKKRKKKEVFCAVSLQFGINHTCIHTLTSTHMQADIHQERNNVCLFFSL